MAMSPQAYRNFDPEISTGPQKDVAAGLPGYRRVEGGEEEEEEEEEEADGIGKI